MPLPLPRALIAVALCAPLAALAQGRVHGDALKAPPGMKPHEIVFERPDDGKARAEWKSETFLAVILTSAKRCALTEEDRVKAQAFFPGQKVFMTRFECGEEENVTYTNVDPKVAFIAVHAGETLGQAQRTVAKAKATGKFPRANLRRMQAVLVYP